MRPRVTSPTGTVIGLPVSIDLVAALDPVGGVHRHRADAVVAEVLLHLADQLRRFAVAVAAGLDRHRRVDLRQRVGEDRVDDDAGDLLDAPDVRAVAVPLLSAIGSFSWSSKFCFVCV